MFIIRQLLIVNSCTCQIAQSVRRECNSHVDHNVGTTTHVPGEVVGGEARDRAHNAEVARRPPVAVPPPEALGHLAPPLVTLDGLQHEGIGTY